MFTFLNNIKFKEQLETWFSSLKNRDLSIQFSDLKGQFDKLPLFISFKNFIHNLTTILRLISRSSTTVNQNMKDILSNSKNLQEETATIHNTMEDFEKSLEKLSYQMANLTAELEEIRYQSKLMVERNAGIFTASKEVQNSLNDSAEEMENSVFLISELVEQNKELKQTVGDLWKNYGSIVSVSDELVRLARQTELIALNAEIESARAGEEGKAFAIVAQEMGKLSQNNSRVAKVISTSILNMREQAKITEVNVVSSVEFAEGAQKEINSANNTYQNINSSIKEVIKDSSEYSNSLKSLETTIIMISEALKEINYVMPKLVNHSHDVVEAISSQETNLNKIKNAVSSTFGVSRILNSLISQFVVPNFKNATPKQILMEGLLEKVLNLRGTVVMSIFSNDIELARNLYIQKKEIEIDVKNYLNSDTPAFHSIDKASFVSDFSALWKDYCTTTEEAFLCIFNKDESKAKAIYEDKSKDKIKEIVDLLLSSLSS